MKQFDMSTKQYNLRDWKATTKQLHVRVKIKKLRVCMIFRVNKILRSHSEKK